MTGRPELPADALGTSGSSSGSCDPCWGGRLALLPVGTTLTPLPPLNLVGFLLPVVEEPLLPVRGVLDLPPVVEGTAGTGALV